MARFHYDPLNRSTNEVRLVTLWPGLFDDPVKIDITHCPLKASTPPRPPDYLSLEALRTTLPQDGSWTVHETLEGHMIFADQLTEADAWTSWAHPDPSVEYSPCDPEAPDLIHRAEPDFEALSYTWGSAIATTTAVVTSVVETLTGGAVQEQTPSRGELSIGHNLEEAIRHLRYSDRPRVMWIDAICIDQQSIQDRNEQVPRMGEIYSLARRVVAWIGPGFGGSKSAMTSLDYLGSQIEFTKDRLRVPRPGCAEPTWYDRAVALPYDENNWEAIATVFSRPWFSRLWILQEIQLGSASSVIRCGNDEVRWSTLCRALFTLYHKDEGVPARLHEAMYEPRVICDYSASVKFDHLLWTYDTRACSDQRDKIYGLMNLAPSEIACRISVDYSRSVAEVYKQTFSVYLEYYRRLDFLVQAGLDQRTAASSTPSQWPTWLPNWSRKSVNTLSPDAGFCASGFSASRAKLDDSTNKLEAAGVFLSAVSSVDCLDSMDFVHLVQYLKGLGMKKLNNSTYYTGESLLDAYLLTLSCCEVEDRYPAAGFPTMACLRDRVMELATGKEMAESDHALSSSYEERFALQLRDSHLFLTSDGHVGTCRTKAEVLSGDRVFIPLGCEAPILLRPSHDGTYRIVGDCYVHGVMHGEALLGPIEDPWTALIYRRTDGVFRTYFQIGDKAEDAAVLDDPRLQQLPLPPDWESIGWGMTAGDAKYCPKYRHKETGEEINYDPRMAVEALISRGVIVETVTIL